ncbi:diaminobutyrate acetyltransferase [Pararhizobium mangrovi]|uniref:L-2,4-diaminobutyric acid acetyltransferase n=1 Tax=Pararhizobium mangrovi TaxID=2590452 RepID=A0A506UEG1_9HYPH|nr:diaminobutyrate acetyltransferase [Pararhizobium mangrovi]TPW31255.1 diaminobutyrate acetyltransferase [Pararhizobium mangrovi]
MHPVNENQNQPKDDIVIREPTEQDGSEIWKLVRDAGTLDENSMYCNLLQCTHFSSTCALAERNGEAVGWVSAYIPPEDPDRLFVWQVCVREDARGHGLGKRLVRDVLAREVCAEVAYINTTITDDNDASWSLFGKIAAALDADIRRAEHFEEDTHFDGNHATEHLVSIGPFARVSGNVKSAA